MAAGLLTVMLIASSHGGNSKTSWGGHIDGEASRSALDRSVPVRRAGARVQHVRVDANLPVDRNGRCGWRRVSISLATSLRQWQAARRKGSGCSPSLLAAAFFLCLVGITSTPIGAQQRTESREVPPEGGTYRRPLGNDPATLDPARIGDIYGRSVSQQIFDGLVQFDHTLSIVPSLAKFWTASRDGLTWTFTLRKGVRFHHGRELTADDVVYSLTRLLDPRVKSGGADLFGAIRGAQDFQAGRARQVSGLSAVDPYTVQIVLTETLAPFV